MDKLYQRLLLLLLFIGVVSGAVIYYTVDINTLQQLSVFQPWSLLVVAGLLAAGFYFDGTRLMHLVHIAGEQITLTQAVQVIFGNYFLALLTPGAAGGAFAQLLFLRHAGVPVGKATVLVLVRTILSILFLLVCLPVVFYYDRHLVPWVEPEVLAGGAVSLLVLTFGGIIIMRTRLPGRLLLRLVRHWQLPRRRRVVRLFHDVQKAITMLWSAPLGVARAFIESALSLIALYSIVPVLMMGVGAAPAWVTLLGRMIFLNFVLYFAPTPGGAGIAEGGFMLLFGDAAPVGTVGVLAVAWRLFAEYLPFCLGLIFTLRTFGHEFLRYQNNRR